MSKASEIQKQIRSKYRKQKRLLRNKWFRILHKSTPTKKNLKEFRNDINNYLYSN